MIQKKLDRAAESYGQRKTADKNMQVVFASSFREGAKCGYRRAAATILSALGIYIICTKDYHSEEVPWVWSVNKKQEGYWGGSATYYAPEKSGEAKTHDDAFEQAMQWTLKNLI